MHRPWTRPVHRRPPARVRGQPVVRPRRWSPRNDEASADQGNLSSSSGPPASSHWVTRVRPYLIAGSAYLLLSVIMWIHVWTGHPSSVTTCGCGDTSPTIWYMAWPAYAMVHGQNPLYSTAIGYPTGFNLVFAAFGIVMAPVTWLFGPVTAVNVVLTASPVLSAVAMFALVRRWVSWTPAAFLAGLFYGFSPFVVSNLGVAHVDFIMIAIPPLVVLCLDELLIRQKRRPAVVGVVLGLLIERAVLCRRGDPDPPDNRGCRWDRDDRYLHCGTEPGIAA